MFHINQGLTLYFLPLSCSHLSFFFFFFFKNLAQKPQAWSWSCNFKQLI